jgi:hypothetical protein
MNFGSTNQEEVESTRCCLVYEKSSGNIRLVHEEVTIEGGTKATEEEFRQAALALARHHRLDPDDHGLLLRSELLEPGAAYQIDVAKNCLVRVDDATQAPY